MATSSFTKNFVLDCNKMTKECKKELFGKNTNKKSFNNASHIASPNEIKQILSNLSK